METEETDPQNGETESESEEETSQNEGKDTDPVDEVMEVEEEQRTRLLFEGDDDSFEDEEGNPLYNFLYEYVTHKICDGQTVINENGVEVARASATPEEMGMYYLTHPTTIEEKRKKYWAYNIRRKKRKRRDYIYTRNNAYIARCTMSLIEDYISRHAHSDLALLCRDYINRPANSRTGIPRPTSRTQRIETAEERKRRIDEAIRDKTLRIDDVDTELLLRNYFAYHIKYQEFATRTAAHIIFLVKNGNSSLLPSTGNANIISMLASGISGTGKTALVELIRTLFHMEENGLNRDCYVSLCFGNYSNSSHRGAINGIGVGFDGMRELCLVDHLVKADTAIRARNNMDPNHPNLIFVFIDELCKPSSDVGVLDSLNSLFDRGILERASGNVKFVLPANTRLLFYSAANYGESAILTQPSRNSKVAISAVMTDMQSKNVRMCDIGRIGRIVPFFAFTYSEAHDIMRFVIDCYFDTSRHIQMQRKSRALFVDHYFRKENYSPGCGVRIQVKNLLQEVDHLQSLRSYVTDNPRAVLAVRFDSIPYTTYKLCHNDPDTAEPSIADLCTAYPELAMALSREDVDADNLNECIKTKADIGVASFIYGDKTSLVYIALPESSINEENAAEESHFFGANDDIWLEKEQQIRELVSRPEYQDSPLIAQLFNIIGGIPPPTIQIIPLVTPKRPASSVNHEKGSSKKKRKTKVDPCENQQEMKLCPGRCGLLKPGTSFNKTWYSNDIKRITVTKECGTCRKRTKSS